MNYIDDIFLMDEIFSFEQDYNRKTGISITNVSHWDSSNKFQQHMNKYIQLPPSSSPWNYYYTYSISFEDRKKVLSNLGITLEKQEKTMGLLLQSSTIAIVNIINLLKNSNRNKLCILQPAYFSVTHCCSMFSLDYGIEQISFINNKPIIPVNKILSKGYDSVWITSPVFGTGYYFNSLEINEIRLLKDAGLTIVFDESLALPGKELVREFPIDKNFFAIYSPHKSIGMNGIKFSVIICSKSYEDYLEQWIDVFSGALSCSNRDAVFHYISDNFLLECFPSYISYVNKNKQIVLDIIKKYPFASTYTNSYGHYISIFTDFKTQDNNQLLSLIKSIIVNGHASFIPGKLNGFNNDKLNFRINLTGDSNLLPCATGRILEIIKTYIT